MGESKNQLVIGCILEEEAELSMADLCRAGGVDAETIIALVDEGLIEPLRRERGRWRFAGITLQRVQAALRLERDLGVNRASAALILDLLDENERLRDRLRVLGEL